MDLIPPALIVARYFADEQAKVDELNAEAEEATRAVEEYVEEHAVEEGLLAEAMDDDKITKALATARLKEAKREGSDPDEIKALAARDRALRRRGRSQEGGQGCSGRARHRDAQEVRRLTEADVKALVLDDKWARDDRDRVAGEVDCLTLALVARIQQLGERYAETVGDLDAELAKLEAKVAGHLADMGVEMTCSAVGWPDVAGWATRRLSWQRSDARRTVRVVRQRRSRCVTIADTRRRRQSRSTS